ncbi:MAG: hypothetical protein J7575_05290 [Chloroflexi bacterium]|jgi:hypothetical protein|nr:hypothetical protein [Chloroflexota bacterium]
MINLFRLARIARTEFSDIVVATTVIRDKLRVVLEDGSYIDFWWSAKIPGRFAHHWERIHVDGTIYRHDNMPHPRWKGVSTFPQHYHQEKPDVVVESYLPSDSPEAAVRAFLTFARQTLISAKKAE